MLRLRQFNPWEASFTLEAASWPDLWALLSHIAKVERFVFSVESTAGAFEPITVTFNGQVMWVMRHDFSVEPTWHVYGENVTVAYTNKHMTFVQVEFPDEVYEDPAPAHWWLPTALGYEPNQAEPIIKQLIDSEQVAHTSILMEPSNASYTYPEGF